MADDLDKLIPSIQRHWLDQGLTIVNVSSAEIEAAERRLGSPIPMPHRLLLTKAGIAETQDNLGYRFWHPSEFKPAKIFGGGDAEGQYARYVFADYLDESWWFAISQARTTPGVVFRELGDEMFTSEALGDLSTFVAAYVADDLRLYGETGTTDAE